MRAAPKPALTDKGFAVTQWTETSRQRITVVVVDDHALLRQALCELLDSRDAIDVIAEFDNGRDAVDGILKARPDVVLMDMAMPQLNGIDATRQIKRDAPNTKVLILSGYVDVVQLRDAVRAGASGYIDKRSDIAELMLAIRSVHMGNTFFSGVIARQFDLGSVVYESRRPQQPSDRELLSSREREVLQLIVEGKTIRQIAAELVISPKTVEGHKARIMDKINVKSRTELIRYALRAGLIVEEGRLRTSA